MVRSTAPLDVTTTSSSMRMPPKPFQVYSRLNRDDHPLFENCLFALAQARHFMHLYPQPMTCAVGEILGETFALETAWRRIVTVSPVTPGRTAARAAS